MKQGVTAEDAVRDLAREALQHHRSITAARPALSAALLPLMQALRQPPVQPSAAGRVASLVAAARPHAATAEAQVLSLPYRTPFPAHSSRSTSFPILPRLRRS